MMGAEMPQIILNSSGAFWRIRTTKTPVQNVPKSRTPIVTVRFQPGGHKMESGYPELSNLASMPWVFQHGF